MEDLPKPSAAPCGSCPYRLDVPAGIWHPSEYAKLPRYDGSTLEQIQNGAFGLFFCHQNDGHLCAGWVGCHDLDHLAAVRFNRVHPSAFDYVSPVPLFRSGREAAVHGLLGVNRPDERAQRMIEKLERKSGKPTD